MLKFSDGFGTSSLFEKNTQSTANDRYIEHKTPKSDENLNALALRGIDMGKMNPKENRMPQKTPPIVILFVS